MIRKRNRRCGNNECGVSTGIDGKLTFGTGHLDDHGFWEYPCESCEQASLERNSLQLLTLKAIRRIAEVSYFGGRYYDDPDVGQRLPEFKQRQEYWRIMCEMDRYQGDNTVGHKLDFVTWGRKERD